LTQSTTRDVSLWLLSAIGGVVAALGFLTLGTRGLVVALLLALVVVFGQRRALKASGALAGAGAATLVILTLAISRCLAYSTYLGQSCTAASLWFAMPFVTLALVIGIAYAIPRTSPVASSSRR
jgi:hypothetical protein